MSPVIRVENLSKYYRLGLIGGGTLHEDLNRWWAKVRGRPDPLLRIGETDHGNRKDGQLWALRDVNLEVQEGEILGIIGRNGAGKSTLLKILSHITAPTEGRVKIRGRVGSLLEVGTGFHPELTGRENIYLNGTILGMTRAEVDRKLDEIIDFAEIAQFIDTPVKRYSSGMTVRLAFAVAAHLEPEILIVDEVLAVGDAAFQRKCLSKMEDVSAGGRTVLFVSHNMGSIESLCSTCMVINSGGMKFHGNVRTAIGTYLTMSKGDVSLVIDKGLPRPGIGDVRALAIILLNENNREINSAKAGESITLRICCTSKSKLESMRILVGIYDFFENSITRLDSGVSGVAFEIPRGEFIFECKLSELMMAPGSYFFNIAIYSGPALQDHIDRAVALEIVAGDFFGTGKFFEESDRKMLKMIVKQSWGMKL
jgi:lipopolysaccharide transport system ATP-binding protein